ncbi:hypothetical protein GCM10010302_27580 [Streptomyces polychromogenes]|uniref:Uncharacterized protein n=1 Tax=Streptomyces polychromogenes TaxID=67342 RepID=A0ABN0VCT4_9ACTN
MAHDHIEDVGYRVLLERYVTCVDSEFPRYLELNGLRMMVRGGPHVERFVRRLAEDAAAITDPELEVLLDHGWRPRLAAAWLIGVGRRTSFRERLGELLLASETWYAGRGYCFALARFGTHEDAALLAAYLDRYLPRTDLMYDQEAALGALLHLDARLGTRHADRFTAPGGLWQRWAEARFGGRDPRWHEPGRLRRWTDLQCDFADGRPRREMFPAGQ